MEKYRKVEDLNEYIREEGLVKRPVVKFQQIVARKAKDGEKIETVASDGTSETTNIAKDDDWIVHNVSNPDNQWIVGGKTFHEKYTPVDVNKGLYKPKGGIMNAFKLREAIMFTAPWGETMRIDADGYLLQNPNNPKDIYGICGKDFDATYMFVFTPESLKEAVNELLNNI